MSQVPEDILTKLLELPPENREKVFRYIQREREVGQTPAKEKLEEIIYYLKQKKSDSVITLKSFDMDDIEYEKSPTEYLKSFNCSTCRFLKESKCNQTVSPLFQKDVNSKILCAEFRE